MSYATIQHQDQGWVHCNMVYTKDNTNGIEGRGFTIEELKLAGIRRKEAKSIGIAVDARRRSKSEEGQKLNVDRLKEYKTRLVVFPKKAGKPKAGDSTASFCFVQTWTLTNQQGDNLTAHITRSALPLPTSYEAEAPRSITSEEKEFNAFRTLRIARADQRNSGKRAARAALRAAQEEASKK